MLWAPTLITTDPSCNPFVAVTDCPDVWEMDGSLPTQCVTVAMIPPGPKMKYV